MDTSTWFITIISMILTLFILFQSKISNYLYYPNPSPKDVKTTMSNIPWENKWTKIYSPLSLPQH